MVLELLRLPFSPPLLLRQHHTLICGEPRCVHLSFGMLQWHTCSIVEKVAVILFTASYEEVGGFYSRFLFTTFQHPMMPPYGTPVPYPAMYPPGGVYAHPGMVTV